MPGPIDIIRSKLEADNSKKLTPEEQKKLDAIVADHFENALKSLGDDADVKPIIAKLKDGKYADALKDLRAWENTRFRAESDKETFAGKAETLIAYLEEINSLETAKNKEINDIINETKKSLFEIFDDTQKSNFSKDIKNLYNELAKSGKVSAEVTDVVPTTPVAVVDANKVVKKEKVPVRSMKKREAKKPGEKPSEVVEKKTIPAVETKKDVVATQPEFTAGDNATKDNVTPVETKKENVVAKQPEFTAGDNAGTTGTVVTSFDVKKPVTTSDFTPADNVQQSNVSSQTVDKTGVPTNQTERSEVKDRNAQDYEDIDGYLDMTDRNGSHFLSGRVKREFKNFLAQSSLSMSDVISDEGHDTLRDFLKIIKNVDLKSAMNALLTDPTVLNAKIERDEDGNKTTRTLSSSEIRKRWNEANAKGLYAPDGGKLNNREEKMLVSLSRMLTPIYLKNSDNLTKGEEAVMLILNTAKGDELMKGKGKDSKTSILKTAKGLEKVKEGLSEESLQKVIDKGWGLEQVMKGLLGDLNYDNKVKIEGKKADKGTLTGGQLAEMYGMEKKKLALRYPEQAEEAMMANIVDLLLSEAEPKTGNQTARLEMGALRRIGFDRAHVKTEKQFLLKCKDYPTLLLVLQQKVMAEGEQAPLLFERGAKYAQEVYEREIRTKEPSKPEDGLRKFSGAENIEKTISNIEINTQRDVEKRIGEQYAAMLTALAEQINTGKTSDGKDIPADLLPELEKSLKILKSDKVAAENKKALKVDVFAAAVSEIEGNEGAGIAANLTSEKINDRLSNEKNGWINSINLSAGVFSPFEDMTHVAVGAILSFTGSKTWNQASEHRDNLKNGGEHRFLYAAGIGAGFDTNSGKFLAGPALAAGYEEQINANSMSKRLDARSAKYIGAMVHGTLVSWGVDAYFRRDKVKGIIEQQAHIEHEFANIINSALNTSGGTVSFDSVRKNLVKDFPKASKDIIYAATQNIISMIGPYKEVFNDPKNTDAAAKRAVVNAIARDYALLRRNDKMTDVNGNFALTGFGGGVEFIAGVLPIPRAGLQFTKYKGLAYSEMQESLTRAHDIIKNGWGVDDDNRASTTILERLPQLNALFNKEGATEKVEYFHKDDAGNLIIDKDILGQHGFNFHILPELKQFIKTNNAGGLVVPGSIPMMLRTLYRDKKYEQDFIIGSVGVKHTEAITSFDGFNGSPEKYPGADITKEGIEQRLASNKEGQRIAKYLDIVNVEKGEKGCVYFSIKKAKEIFGDHIKIIGIDTLREPGKETVYSISKKSFLKIQENTYRDGRPSELLMDVSPADKGLQLGYLHKIYAAAEKITSSAGDIQNTVDAMYKGVSEKIKELSQKEKIGENNQKTMDMRYGSGKADYVAFVKAMDAGDLTKAKKYAQNLTGFEPSYADMRWLNAKLCMTAQTRDKDVNHIEGGEESIIKQAQEIAKRLGINSQSDIDLIKDIITCADCVTRDGKKALLTKIEKLPTYSDRNSDAYRLHSMLLNLEDIAATREGYLLKHIRNEKGLKNEINAIKDLRKESLSGVHSECLYHGKPLPNAIGMVFGYSSAAGLGVQEKFVGNPSIAEGQKGASTYTEKGITSGLKEYYLDNLFGKSSDIIEALIKDNPKYKELLNKIIKDNPKIYDKVKDENKLSTAFINELKKDNGQITANFGFAFYNECFNETLIMKDLSITGKDTPVPVVIEEPKMDTQVADITISPDNGFYVDNYATTSKANVKNKNYIVGATWGGTNNPSHSSSNGTPGSNPGDGDTPPTTPPGETPGG